MNHLLSSFPAPVQEALDAQPIALVRGATLIGIGARVERAYFPTSAVIAGVVVLADAGPRAAGVVGAEGVVGFDGLWHQPEIVAEWIVQVPGEAQVVELARLRAAVERWPATVPDMLAFCHAFLAQVVRSAACNGTHAAERRFARWLLLCHDRVPTDQLAVTHEFAAQMLGMARPRVTRLARAFQSAGLLRSSRGVIEIADRAALERASCECYASIRGAYAALLPYVPMPGHPMASACGRTSDASTGSSGGRSPK